MSTDRTMPGTVRNLCVLFADISGSTALYERLGDAHALSVIEQCIRLMDDATRRHHGRTVETIGDEILATFPSVDNGVEAAVDMMARIAFQPAVAGKRLALRIGCHFGPVLLRQSHVPGGPLGVSGDTVNTAARIVALAKPQQILTSLDTINLLSPKWQRSSRIVDTFAMKGKSADMLIAEIFWEQQDHTTLSPSVPPPAVQSAGRLVVTHRERCYVLDGTVRRLTIGRETGNDIVIDDRRISREHLRLEHRRNRFVLADNSTNGTYVALEGADEVLVRREEIILSGRGRISLGHAYDAIDPTGSLTFELE